MISFLRCPDVFDIRSSRWRASFNANELVLQRQNDLIPPEFNPSICCVLILTKLKNRISFSSSLRDFPFNFTFYHLWAHVFQRMLWPQPPLSEIVCKYHQWYTIRPCNSLGTFKAYPTIKPSIQLLFLHRWFGYYNIYCDDEENFIRRWKRLEDYLDLP